MDDVGEMESSVSGVIATANRYVLQQIVASSVCCWGGVPFSLFLAGLRFYFGQRLRTWGSLSHPLSPLKFPEPWTGDTAWHGP